MKILLLSISLSFFINLNAITCQSSSIYDQLVVVNKHWSTKTVSKNLKELHIQLSHTQLIQTHLLLVENTLRNKPLKNLSSNQKQKRNKALDDLRAYAINGVFPINLYHNSNTPYFIDHLGTACAVGQLIINSEHQDLANKIKASDNYGYIENMVYPELNDWASKHGFTKQELMWIQPTYFPYCPLGTKKDPNCHDGTGCINPDYATDSLVPPYQKLFEFNDGNGWVIDTNGQLMRWQGARIGDHRITVTDSLNTVKVYNYTINNVAEMQLNSTTINQTSTPCNGSASITIQNGKAPYIIQLQNQSLNYFASDSIGNFDSLCNGTYLIVVYDSFRCQKTDSLVIDNVTGLTTVDELSFQIYPNPFNDLIYINFLEQSKVDYKLYSISGRLIKQGVLNEVNKKLDTKDLNSGIYFIDFISNGQHFRKKLVKSE